MLTYNQRYKPRTEREYTKSDLTVYDSAGNTALNTLKVYGKSEIVDGAIKSAGEGWATVDLGTLTWLTQSSAPERYEMITSGLVSVAKKPNSNGEKGNIICKAYTTVPRESVYAGSIGISLSTSGYICVYDPNYGQNDAEAFKSAMSGVLLAYQLADPSQGNTIAIKTDNGTGINGTMATFSTGTPLYGVSDTVRDVMQWDGSAGTVTKKCSKVRLADLTWSIINNYFTATLSLGKYAANSLPAICQRYTVISNIVAPNSLQDKQLCVGLSYTGLNRCNIIIKDTDYTTVSDFVASLGDAELVYQLATPTTEQLTQTENDSIASLRTFDGTTHCTNNASTDMTVNYTIKVPTIN